MPKLGVNLILKLALKNSISIFTYTTIYLYKDKKLYNKKALESKIYTI